MISNKTKQLHLPLRFYVTYSLKLIRFKQKNKTQCRYLKNETTAVFIEIEINLKPKEMSLNE